MEGWKSELQKIKKLSNRERIQYLWEYYKLYILLPLLILCLIAGVYYSLHSDEPEVYLYGAVVNAGIEVERLDGLAEELEKELDLNNDKKIVVDGSYSLASDGVDTNETMMDRAKLTTYIMGKELDFVILPETYASQYCGLNAFYDFDNLLSQGVLQQELLEQEGIRYQALTKEGLNSYCGIYIKETIWGEQFPELKDDVFCIPKTTEHLEDVKTIIENIVRRGD